MRVLLIPAVGWALSMAVSRSLGADVDWWGVLACIAGVHAAYRFDAIVDSVGMRAVWRDRRSAALIVDGLLLGAAAISSPALLPALAALSLCGLLYTLLKRVIPKNLLTAGAWTATVFGLSLHGTPVDARVLVVATSLFMLVLSNAILCDLPDVEADRRSGVIGIASRFGLSPATRIAGGTAACAALLAAWAGAWPLCVPACGYALLAARFSPALQSRRDLRVWIDALLISPGPLSFLIDTTLR